MSRSGADGAGDGALRRATWSQRHDGIRDAVGSAVEDAADRAGVVDDAVGLAALDDT